MKARIVIPTRARPEVKTFYNLPKEIQKRTVLVIRPDEEWLYEAIPCKKIMLDKGVEGLSPTRQWILDNIDDRYVIQLDDDFSSYSFKPDMRQWKLIKATPRQVVEMFELVDFWLRKCVVHAGIMDRVRAAQPSKSGEEYSENTLCMQFLGYDQKILQEEGVRFDRVRLAQDKDVCLQLLERGYGNRVSKRFSYNCSGTDTTGGCAVYRTEKLRIKQAKLLARLHPGIVTQIQKTVKKHGETITRMKNRVSWKLAFCSRIKDRVLPEEDD